MEPYQVRMLEEREELAEKVERLQKFNESTQFSTLEKGEQNRLRRQLDAMCLYLYILNERIDVWY